MLTRRQIVETSIASALIGSVPTAGWAAAAGSKFDLKAYLEDVNEVLKIDSKTGYEEGVNKVIDVMERRFKSVGWTTSLTPLKGRGNALVCTTKPDQSHYDIILCAHADTVQPVGNAAKYPLRVEGTIAHGAGISDDKCSLTAVWWICKDLPKSIREKLNIAVVINPGEESGNKATRKFMADEGKKAPMALVYEPGRPDNGAVRQRKGSTRIKLSFHGVAAHAGNNPQDGRNAINAMANAIPKIVALADMFDDVTVSTGVCKGGTTPNTVAAEAEVIFDVRFFNNEHRDAIIAAAEKLVAKGFAEGVTTEMDPGSKGSALTLTEPSKVLISLVDEAASKLGQPALKWMDVGGASDGNKMSGVGCAVACAMGVCGGDLHNPEKEWADLTTVAPRIALGKKVLEMLAAKK